MSTIIMSIIIMRSTSAAAVAIMSMSTITMRSTSAAAVTITTIITIIMTTTSTAPAAAMTITMPMRSSPPGAWRLPRSLTLQR